ncbi:MAG: lysine transporter LysE [Alphaproteobacteria bacterium]|nr:lysine transporter LysE [Alphaproteobacteria bacterium]
MASVLAAISAIWFAAHLSPGPDFLVTIRVAMTQSRAAALRTVLGICVGTVVWAVAGFYGLNALFAALPWLYQAMKYAGGAYLAYLGLRMVIASFRRLDGDGSGAATLSDGSAFRLGLLTNLANPKAALFTASVFAATLPPDPPALLGLAATVVMTAISLAFYGLLAGVLTTPRISAGYARAQHWIDRIAGAAFVFFAVDFALRG